MTRFDDLSIDVLLKIFNYLPCTDLFYAFFGLQKRLDHAIQDCPACVNLSKVSNHHGLLHFSFQCRSLILSGPDLHSFQMNYSQLNLTSLRGVTLKKMNLLTLHSFIKTLPMQQLESITIGRLTWHYYPLDLYRQIWSLIMNSINGNRLRYLHLPYHVRYWNTENILFDFSTLRHATLEYISASQMLAFMSHCPNLRRFKACLAAPHKDIFRYKIILPKLNHLTLNLQDEWSLEEIRQLLIICPHLNHLILKLEARTETNIMFEPTVWQTLIEEKLPHLIRLRLRLNYIIVYPDTKRYNFQEKFNQAEYWIQRQTHFKVAISSIQREVL